MSYHVKIYGEFILGSVPDCEEADVRWLSNRMGKLHKKVSVFGGCRDNFRVCRALPDGSSNKKYLDRKHNGCCGSFDTQLINPQTGNTFWYGFNYGH